MRIQFVRRNGDEIVERGKTIEVVSTECGWYRIIDDMGEECLLPPSMFEVVEQLPKPPETQPLGIETDKEWYAYLEREYGAEHTT